MLLSHATDLTGLVSVSVSVSSRSHNRFLVSVSISFSHSLVSVLALVSLCSGLINKPGNNKLVFFAGKMAKFLIELQNDTLKRENETLSREIVQWRQMYYDLKRSLDDAITDSSHHITRSSEPIPSTHSDNSSRSTVDEVREKLRQKDELLKRTARQLNEARKQLANAQEQLTVSKEVAKATQIRELRQEGIYEDLVTDKIYVSLRQDWLKEDFNAKPQQTSQTGRFGRLSAFAFLPRNTVRRGIFCRKVAPAVHLSVCLSVTRVSHA